MMKITEDTPPDMLSGAMDLMVHLPDGKKSKMSVERSTPMMDVLVQITNANHLQISGYVLQPIAIHSTPGIGEKVLHFFPNTPIGTLDTKDIRVMAKNRNTAAMQRGVAQQPFESTFRLKVHLPRNQLYVERVSMNAYLQGIMKKMCEEKNLDASKFELRHPGNLDQVLDLQLCLADYQITEIYAVQKGTNRLSQVFASSDSIMAFRKDDERKQKLSNGGGLFNFFKRGATKSSNGSGSLSSDNRSISPTHSDDSRSVSPPMRSQTVAKSEHADKPKQPQRKRRPAPKPPSNEEKCQSKSAANEGKKDGLTICHSRNSSDSSGYHEASILSDNANTSLPRKRPQTILENAKSNLQAMRMHSKSTSSLAFPGRTKKKAPPPPVIQSASSITNLEHASPVIASRDADENDTAMQPEDSLGNNASVQSKQVNNQIIYTTNSPTESFASSLAATLSSNLETEIADIKETENVTIPDDSTATNFDITTEDKCPEENESDTKQTTKSDGNVLDTEMVVQPENDKNASPPSRTNTDWEYQLPSPPTAFRDSSPVTESEAESGAGTDSPASTSIITSPVLFEKLNIIMESQSEVRSTKSMDSEDDKFISTLSVENLEKRKKLVYNRELATSLKCCESETEPEIGLANKRSSVLTELEDVLSSKSIDANKNWNRSNSKAPHLNASRTDSTLPNFKITTYDIPKKKINIFEDDSVRSNVNAIGSDTEPAEVKWSSSNVAPSRSMTLNREFLQRSETFNTWTRSVPVKRSKSQLPFKPEPAKKDISLGSVTEESRSKSTLDLTGLQSIEVMKAIKHSLTTSVIPDTSSDEVDAVSRESPKVILPQKRENRRPVSCFGIHSVNSIPRQERKPSIENPSFLKTSSSQNGHSGSLNSNVSIKVNGSEAISSQESGNVVIKIAPKALQDEGIKRFINHTTAAGYRKPLGNVNKVATRTTRPHSIAFDGIQQFDATRLPIVRSMELKKTFKHGTNGFNTSVTQIRPDSDSVHVGKVNVHVHTNNLFRRPVELRTGKDNIKMNADRDTRGQLLNDIRNFGGRKGLKAMKI